MLTIYKSSAGSGKTYTLVLEYLKIVILEPQSYRHVLAITFTNKATEEMKARIILTLSKLATTPKNQLQQDSVYVELRDFLAEKGKSDLEVSNQARKVLELILNDYSNFSVSTIESFFQKIVRAFARELNIPLGYDVEMKQDLVLQKIVGELFLDIGRREGLTKLMEGFVDRNLEEERTWNVDVEVRALGGEIFKEQFQQLVVDYPDERDPLTKTLSLVRQLMEIRSKFENRFKTLSEEATGIMDKYHLEVGDFLYGRTGVGAYVCRFLQPPDPKYYKPTSRSLAAYEDPSKWAKKGSPRIDDIQAAVNGGLENILAEMVSLYQKKFASYFTAIQVLRTLHSFGLLNELQSKLAEYRRENAQMIISDTSFLLRNVVNDHYDAPFIYEKVGNRYQHYLLDEFQDTSDMQWYNLLPLIREALAYGKQSLIVGDVKQSIYRWRNGNMRLLLEVVENEIRKQGQEARVKNLADNYRTAREIVGFNNRFFQEAADVLSRAFSEEEELFTMAYYEVSQNPQKNKLPGLVSIEFFAADKDEDTVPWREQALDRTLEVIRSIMEDGYRGKDITLLVRTNSDGMQIAEFLQKEGIKVISAESLLVASDKRVLLLQSMLQHLNHEQDAITGAGLKYYYSLVNQENNELHALFSDTNFEGFSTDFEASKEALRRLPVYECVERLMRLFPALTEPNAYVQGFLDAVLDYSSSNDASISGFLEWWQDARKKLAIASSPESEAVQIMTIHKAKGLEFPFVIVPFADWRLGPGNREILWVKPELPPYDDFSFLPIRSSKSLEDTYFHEDFAYEQRMSFLDSLNLLYVAFTRPVYRLYVFTQKDKPEPLTGVGKLINQMVESQTLEGEYDEENNRFSVGTAVTLEELSLIYEHKADSSEPSIPLKTIAKPMESWNKALRIRYSSNRFLNSDILTRTEKISEGELLHEALSYIESEADIETAVSRLIHKGYIVSSQVAFLKERISRIIANVQPFDWFSGNWQVRNEAEILTEGGKTLRPDRVMIKKGEAVVVDYKSGKKNDKFLIQVLEYMQALTEIGYAPVRGFIYYTRLENGGLLEEVSL